MPPKIYKVEGLGVGSLYMPAAYVESYDVQSIGTTRRIYDLGYDAAGGVLIPEAYKVSITFRELVPESSNIMAGSLGQEKVSVISENTGILKSANAIKPTTASAPNVDLSDAVKNTVKDILKDILNIKL